MLIYKDEFIMINLGEKEFSVFHWDTFEEDYEIATILLDSFDTLLQAEEYVEKKYKGRISNYGADRVQIVSSSGDVVKWYGVR
jgi:hypothetical protein